MTPINFFVIILAFIVIIGIVNERIFHIQSDIALIMFSLIISLILVIVSRIFDIKALSDFTTQIGEFGFEEYLLKGVLCFMLFAGASKVNMWKFKQNILPITLLALLSTGISSFLYGGLFYLIALPLKIPEMNIWKCILLGCVVSPTDPIAATGILNKIGLSKNVCSVIENESLFNDGTGVALFLFVSSLVKNTGKTNFAILMFKEIAGAVAVALVVSFILFKLMELTKDPIKYILISLFDVGLVYVICEEFGFSGVIASVVCGMYFSYCMNRMERRVMVIDPKEYYKDFWEILESILNAALFVMIGLLALNINISRYIWIAVPAALIILIISRASGVFISSVLTGRRIPGNYSLKEFVILMTWSALKGGLSLALALQTAEYLNADIYDLFINVTYVTIFFTVLVQGLTVKKVYYKLEELKVQRRSADHVKKA